MTSNQVFIIKPLTDDIDDLMIYIESNRLYRSGYMPIRNLTLARIDRPDWRFMMAYSFGSHGYEWVEGLGYEAANVYRDRHSKDIIVVSEQIFLAVKKLAFFSTWQDYRELLGSNARYKATQR